MAFTQKEKNEFIGTLEQCLAEISRIQSQISSRLTQFKSEYGDKTATSAQDITTLSNRELKIRLNTLAKVMCEIGAVRAGIISETNKLDREIVSRQ